MNRATGAITTTSVGSDRPVTNRKTSRVWPLAVTRSSSRSACVSQIVPVSADQAGEDGAQGDPKDVALDLPHRPGSPARPLAPSWAAGTRQEGAIPGLPRRVAFSASAATQGGSACAATRRCVVRLRNNGQGDGHGGRYRDRFRSPGAERPGSRRIRAISWSSSATISPSARRARDALGAAGADLVARAAASEKFKGRSLSALSLPAPGGRRAPTASSWSASAPRRTAPRPTGRRSAASPPARSRAGRPGWCSTGRARRSRAAQAGEFALGARLRDYAFDRYKTKKKPDAEDEGRHRADPPARRPRRGRPRGRERPDASSEGVILARDLVNEPPNVLFPEEFARRASDLSKLGVEVEVLRAGADARARHGRAARRGAGLGPRAARRDHALERRPRRRGARRLHRQGRGVRFRRHLDQARRRHGGHEGRHGRRGRRRRRAPRARGPQGAAATSSAPSASSRTCRTAAPTARPTS